MIATFAVLAVFVVVDLFIIGRRPHVPSTKECVQHIAFFVVAALIFGGIIWAVAGSKPAVEFYSGWMTEYSLSIDNLFVFVIIMSNFAVPKELQKYVLSVGITVALVLLGLGWSAVTVAGSTLLTEASAEGLRTKRQGRNDFAMSLVAAIGATGAGGILTWVGFNGLALFALPIIAVMVVLSPLGRR